MKTCERLQGGSPTQIEVGHVRQELIQRRGKEDFGPEGRVAGCRDGGCRGEMAGGGGPDSTSGGQGRGLARSLKYSGKLGRSFEKSKQFGCQVPVINNSFSAENWVLLRPGAMCKAAVVCVTSPSGRCLCPILGPLAQAWGRVARPSRAECHCRFLGFAGGKPAQRACPRGSHPRTH